MPQSLAIPEALSQALLSYYAKIFDRRALDDLNRRRLERAKIKLIFCIDLFSSIFSKIL